MSCRPEEVQRLVEVALEALSESAGDSTADEMFSALLTLAVKGAYTLATLNPVACTEVIQGQLIPKLLGACRGSQRVM